jgi:gliding motility-associated-like protein
LIFIIKLLSSRGSYTKTTIYIFDRYGKILKQLAPLGNGWDGTFNELLMPASDYWYSIYFEDGRISKGHFTLKR